MKKLFAILATAAFLAGCASTPQEKGADMLAEMQKEKTALIDKGVVAGFGIGESQDEMTAYNKADLAAREDIARELESKLGNLSRSYTEEVGSELTKHYEEITKNVVSQTLRGATLIKVKTEATEKTIKVYGIMVLDPKLVKDAFEAEMQAKQADVARMRAAKGYGDLNAEIAAYDQFKKENQ